MTIQDIQSYVSRTTMCAIDFMLGAVGAMDGVQILCGLPAGARHLIDQRLVIAATPCDAPLFEGAMRKAASETGADVVLMKHGLHPETLNSVSFAVLVHVSGKPHLFDDLLLYFHPADGYWLVPSARGAFIALEKDGLRVDFEPPFITFDERIDGVCEAAARIIRSMRADL